MTMARKRMTLGIVLLIYNGCVNVWCQNFSDSRAVHEQLVQFFYNNGKPLTNLIPVVEQSKPISVILTMHLYSVDGFDAITGQVDISGSIYLEWEDETRSSQIGNYVFPFAEEGFSVRISPEAVWVPSVRLTNAVDSVKNIGDTAFKIRYHVFDGRMMWQPKVIMKVSCTPDVKYYPFDRQRCSFVYTSWGYTIDEVLLDNAQSDWYLCDFTPNGVWTLIETISEHYIEHSQSYMKFTFIIERNPLYYFINAVLPVLLLSVLNGVVFLLPADSGERVSFSITCFLAFVIMLQTTMGFLPQTSDPMSLLCFYVVIMVVTSSVVCMLVILLLRVHLKPPDDTVPRRLRSFMRFITCRCFQSLCKRCRSRRRISSCLSSEGSSDMSRNTSVGSELKKLTFPQSSGRESVIDSIASDSAIKVTTPGEIELNGDVNSSSGNDVEHDIKWQDVAKNLDMFLFICYVSIQVALAIVFIVPMIQGPN